MTLTELLKTINADLIEGQGLHAQRLRWSLRYCESPGFTLNQAWYWVCRNYHSGQYSPGYQRLSQVAKDYTPSMSESSESLVEIDSEFDAIYSHLVDRYEEGCLYL